MSFENEKCKNSTKNQNSLWGSRMPHSNTRSPKVVNEPQWVCVKGYTTACGRKDSQAAIMAASLNRRNEGLKVLFLC